MKFTKKALALLLSVILVVSLFPANVYAAGATTNLTYKLSATEVTEGDTFTLAISTKAMSVATFGFSVHFDNSKLEVLKIATNPLTYTEWVEDEELGEEVEQTKEVEENGVSTRAEGNQKGQVGIYWIGTDDVAYNAADNVLTITFCAVASGTVTISIVEDSSGEDGYKDTAAAPAVTVRAADWSNTATLVTDASTLKAGDQIIIVAADYHFALSTTQKTSNREQALIRKSADATTVSYTSKTQVLTLGEGAVAGTYSLDTGDGYLYAASTSGNQLKTTTTLSDKASWNITISDGVASVVSANEDVRGVMQYNYTSNLFACYASASQKAISIYKLSAAACEHEYDNACDADCNKCGETREVGDHVYDNACDADCNECGATREVGEHVYDNACDADCNTCGATREVAGHVYSNACDADCNECGATRTPAAHVYDNACDADCNECGATRTPADHVYDNDCDADCNECGATRTPADHVYDNDCDADCNECGATRTPADHVYDNDCDTDCNTCGAIREVGEHVYDNACDADCNECGATREVSGHTGGEATCTKLAVCSECGKEYGELAPNNHKNTYIGTVFHPVGDGTHYQLRGCSDCGKKEVEKVIGTCSDETTKDHKCDDCDYVMSTCSGGTATCTAKAQCSTCGAEYGDVDKNNHTSTEVTYTDNNDGTHSATYNCCGAAYVTNEAHDYSYDAATHTCVCGKVETFTVTYHSNGGFVLVNGDSVGEYYTFTYAWDDKVVAKAERVNFNEFYVYCPGLRFAGWNTQADGTGTAYAIGAPIELTENITLYAQYKEIAVDGVALNSGEYLDCNGNVTTTKPAGGYAYYNNGILTLNNFVGTGGKYATSDEDRYYGVNVEGDLILVLEGANTLDNIDWGIFGYNLTIRGDGSLTIKTDEYGLAIYASKSLTIESGNISLTGEYAVYASEGITIRGGTVTGTGYLASYDDGKLTLDGVTVITPAGTTFGAYDFGDYTENCLLDSDGKPVTSFVIGACPHTEKSYTDNEDGSTHTVKCSCGEVLNAAEAHDFTNGDCICGAEKPETHVCTHKNYVTENGKHQSYCECGEPIGEAEDCSGGTATCQAKAVCEKCNTAYGELDKTNHTSDEEKYIQYGDSHAVVYACCNAHKRGENHTYDKTTHRCVCGALEKFTITLNANGGKFNSGAVAIDVSGEYGTDFTAIPEMPTKDGSDLIGWTDELGNTIVLGNYKFTENITVYAQWCDHTKTTATDNGDGTHTVSCPCGATSYSEDHSYDKTPGTCVCGVKLTGWIGNSYYENGEKVTGWKEVDGAWYYFSENGYCTGLQRLPYLTELGYKPNQEDIDYAANKGTAFKDATEAWFYFGQDGKLMTGFTGILDGKFVQNGMIPWHPGFVEVDGEWYYFVGDAENGGNKMANGQIYVTRNAEAAGYETKDQVVFVNGQVDTTVNGIVDKAGVLYYYENGKLMAGNGLTKIGDKYIYVRSSGELAVGEYYIPANDLGVVSALYTFGKDGFMVVPKFTNVNGVVDGYYYKDGKVQYGAGLIEWKGDIYYVRSNGQVATGWYYVTNVNEMEGFQQGMKLNFGEDGKMQPVKNGIVEENDELYYYENNHLKCGAGLLKLEDENGVYYIYVRSSGKVQTGYFYITKTNELEGFEAGMKLNFGEDGKYYPGK